MTDAQIVWTVIGPWGIVVFVTKGVPFDEFLKDISPRNSNVMPNDDIMAFRTSTSGRELATRRWHHPYGGHVRTGDNPDGKVQTSPYGGRWKRVAASGR